MKADIFSQTSAPRPAAVPEGAADELLIKSDCNFEITVMSTEGVTTLRRLFRLTAS